ncbi:MAG: hypothetical protein E7375_03275 [Clostridiales bacterium]|nr:hypothetical protein [Clostridiales bacterium]
MLSTLCSIWDDFCAWVSVGWTQTTFIIVVCVFGILGLMSLLSFFKQSFDKGKKPKWFQLILSLILLGLMAVVCIARF